MLQWCNWLNIPSLQDGDEKYNPGSSPGWSTQTKVDSLVYKRILVNSINILKLGNLSGCRIMAIISDFHSEDEVSITSTRSLNCPVV